MKTFRKLVFVTITLFFVTSCSDDSGDTLAYLTSGDDTDTNGGGDTNGGATGSGICGDTSGTGNQPRMIYQTTTTQGGGLISHQIGSTGDKIVFVTDDDPLGTNEGVNQIFACDDSADTLTQITFDPPTPFFEFMFWDIDTSGSRVVFESSTDITGDNPDTRSQLFVAETDGSSVTQVTSNTTQDTLLDATLTGDGSLVVFKSDEDLTGDNPGRSDQIFKINADGTGLTQVTLGVDEDILEPAISNDGSTIAFRGTGDPMGTNADGSGEIFVITADGLTRTQITMMDDGSLFDPQLSNDGSRVVFSSRDEVLAGGNPDGSQEVYVALTDGTGITQITNTAQSSRRIQISGNGEWVVFSSSADLTGDNARGDETVFSADVNGVTVVQALRDETMPDDIDFRGATRPKISDNGDLITFFSGGNYVDGALTNRDKLYAIDR